MLLEITVVSYIVYYRFDREEEEVSVLGVDSIKYSLIPRNTFGDAETSPDNICYNDANRNLPYGVHNATGCKVIPYNDTKFTTVV